MLKKIGSRIVGRILIFGISAVIVFVIIPFASAIGDFVRNTPSWIFISSCCIGGTLVIGVLYAVGNQGAEYQSKQREIMDEIESSNSAAFKLFDSKLNENPTMTKESYLKLKVAIRSYSYELYVASEPNLAGSEISGISNEELDLARFIFDEFPIQKIKKAIYDKGLIYLINERIRSVELEQEPKALVIFEKRLKEDPEGTVNSFEKLLQVINRDSALAINLSKELFGEAMLIDSSHIIDLASKYSRRFQEIQEPRIISQALKVYANKMAENPHQVIKDYNELLPLLDYLRNPIYYGAPERGDVCQSVFSLSEKLYDSRIEYDILFKITDDINQQ